MGGGNIAEVNPSDSAKDLMKIASDIDTISRKEMFIDHRRNKMPWQKKGSSRYKKKLLPFLEFSYSKINYLRFLVWNLKVYIVFLKIKQ